MKNRPQKSLFPATVATITVVALTGLLLQSFRSSVPRGSTQTLVAGEEEFLLAAQGQEINWQNLSPEVFAQAKLREKPIMLVCGDAMDAQAQAIDEEVFSDREVCAWLRYGFICVRVDLQQHPEWRHNFLQLLRGKEMFNQNWQTYFLLPDGKSFNRIMLSGHKGFDSKWFLEQIRNTLHTFQALMSHTSTTVPGVAQAEDRAKVLDATPATPRFEQFTEKLLKFETSAIQNGTVQTHFPSPSRQILYLFHTGKYQDALRMLNNFLFTPQIDWLRGGVFQKARYLDRNSVDFQKSSPEVAEFLNVLMIAFARTRDPVYKFIAEAAFDNLNLDFGPNSLQCSDMLSNGWSPHYSLRYLTITQVLTSEERDLLWSAFRLQQGALRQQNLVLKDPAPLRAQLGAFRGILTKLANAQSKAPLAYEGYLQADTCGRTYAKMLRLSRLFSEDEKTRTAAAFSTRLESLIVAGSAVHSNRPKNEGHHVLKDSLAIADDLLEQYLVTGNYQSLLTGAQVLGSAVSEFSTERQGVLVEWKPIVPEQWPPDIVSPELVDSMGESSVSMTIRLCYQYGNLMKIIRDPNISEELGKELEQAAMNAIRAYAEPAFEVGWNCTSYFSSAYRALNSPSVLVKGPLALDVANELSQRCAPQWVAPLIGPLAPEWEARPNGVYVLRQGHVEGPLSPDEAVGRVLP